MVSLRELPDEELVHMLETTEAYLTKLQNEAERRDTVASAEELVNDLNLKYFQALGRRDGEPWEGPSTASESYPRGWVATHEGGMWKSLEPGNIQEPGESEAWEYLGEDPDSSQDGDEDEDDQTPEDEGDNAAQGILVPSEDALPSEYTLPTDGKPDTSEEDDPGVEVILDRGDGDDS